MSLSSHGRLVDGGCVLVGHFDLPAGQRFGWHDHAEHQLAWAASGVLTVTAADRTWVLPPTRALWIPAGVRHATGASTPAAVRSPYFPTGACPLDYAEPTPVVVDDLLAALIRYLARPELPDDARARAVPVVFDVLAPVPAEAVRVPRPRDPRARQVAVGLLGDPADDRDLAAWGREVGASARTLTRLFAAETGLSWGRWRTQARLRAALINLADGVPVATVGHRVGYRTASAFVAAFRQTLGTPPGRYFSARDR
jgi:AraC-like DNA-binding protein